MWESFLPSFHHLFYLGTQLDRVKSTYIHVCVEKYFGLHSLNSRWLSQIEILPSLAFRMVSAKLVITVPATEGSGAALAATVR